MHKSIAVLPEESEAWRGPVKDALIGRDWVIFKQRSAEYGPYVLAVSASDGVDKHALYTMLYSNGWHSLILPAWDDQHISLFTTEWSGSASNDQDRVHRTLLELSKCSRPVALRAF